MNNRLYWHTDGEGIESGFSPFIGHTVQNTTVNGYSEGGDPTSARTVDGTSETTHAGEIGVMGSFRFGGENDDLVGLEVEASVDTEQRFNTVASLDFSETIVLTGFHQISDNSSNSGVSANIQFRF